MNNTEKKLPDIQNTEDARGKVINRTGVSGFYLPILFKGKETIAKVAAYCSLPHVTRGANFSRFPLCATEHFTNKEITSDTLIEMLQNLKERMKSQDAYVDIEFNYLMEKLSPVSNIEGGYQNYKLGFIGRLKEDGLIKGLKEDDSSLIGLALDRENSINVIRRFEVTAASVCPCSREMSLLENSEEFHHNCEDPESVDFYSEVKSQVGKGAHNQRVTMRVDISFTNGFDIDPDEIIKGIESCASVETYPILKRADEKWVTEKGYDNPKFVEDIARDIALYLDNISYDELRNTSTPLKIIDGYSIKVEADESIHQHQALAYIHTDNWRLH